MPSTKRKKVAQMLPISPWLLAGLVVAIIFIAIFLIPSEKRLIEEYMLDQDWDKAHAALQALPEEERAAQAAYYDNLELRLRRLRLDPADAEGHAALLSEAVLVGTQHGFTPQLQVEIDQLIARAPGTIEIYRLIEPHLGEFPEETRDNLIIRFADRAVGDERADVGLQIFAPYWEQRKGDIHVLSKYMQIAGYAGRQDLAIRALEEYEATLREPLHVHNRELALRKVRLLEQSAEPAAAFAQMRSIYDHADEETKRELYPWYERLAGYVSQQHRLLPGMIQKTRNEPSNPVAWRELAEMAKSLGNQKLEIQARSRVVVLAPKDGDSAMRLGQLLQWNNQPNRSFDAYIVALDRGADQALEQIIALNQGGLFRDVELFQAMERMGDRLDLRKHGLTMARLAANLSDFAKAKSYYEQVLRQRGDVPDILAEYGLMMLDIGRHEEAIAIYSRAAARGGDDFKVMVSIAEAQFRAGKFEEALKTYQNLLRLNPTRRQLENYLRLAESMGRIEEAANVLWAFMQNSGEAERKDYQKLAYYNGVLGRSEALETTLREAFQKYPEDPTIRKQLLYAYSDNQKSAEAAALLATFPELGEDKELSEFYLSLLVQAKRFKEVEKFINELPPGTADEWKLNELLVGVYYETGNTNAIFHHYGKLHESDPANSKWALTYAQLLLDRQRNAEAKRIVSRITGEGQPQAYKLAAQLHAADREYKQAELFQRKYLDTDPKDSGRDWGFMGDILGERGDKPGAQRAYRRAISEMLDTMATIANTNAPAANASVN